MDSKKTIYRVSIIVTIAIAVHIVLALIVGAIGKQIWNSEIPDLFRMVASLILMDGVILPAMCFAFSKIPGKLPVKDEMSVKDFFMFFAMVYGLAICCNYITVMVNGVLMELTGHGSLNTVLDMLSTKDTSAKIVTYVFAVIVAPIMEELTFRRFLLTRLLPYGEKMAIVTSGIMFGLFHGNMSQAFYAAVLGIGLGYMYVRTGNLRNNILLHMCINTMGTLAGILLGINPILGGAFGVIMMIFALWGVTVFINHKSDMYVEHFEGETKPLEAWKNIGMVIFVVAVVIEIIYSFWNA